MKLYLLRRRSGPQTVFIERVGLRPISGKRFLHALVDHDVRPPVELSVQFILFIPPAISDVLGPRITKWWKGVSCCNASPMLIPT